MSNVSRAIPLRDVRNTAKWQSIGD